VTTKTAAAMAAGLVLAGCGMAPLAPLPAPRQPEHVPTPQEALPAPVAVLPPAVPERFADPLVDLPDPEAPAADTAAAPPVPLPEVGTASWYGRAFHGRRTANGERYDMHALTAAHPSLPLSSFVQVRHLGNRREVVLRINDRGPFKAGRIIDLSHAAARLLGIAGIAKVEVVRLAHDDQRAAALPAPPPRRAQRAPVVREVQRADAARPQHVKAEPARRAASVSASAARRSIRSG
jgi:rare lipoprotein A